MVQGVAAVFQGNETSRIYLGIIYILHMWERGNRNNTRKWEERKEASSGINRIP